MSFVKYKGGSQPAQFLERIFQASQIAAANQAGRLAQFAQQHGQKPAGAQGGVSDDQRQISFGFEPFEPIGHQRTFAGAVVTDQEHERAQGGRLLEQAQGLLPGRREEGVGAGAFTKRHGPGAPMSQGGGQQRISVHKLERLRFPR